MKKILNIILIALILWTSFIPYNFDVKAESCTYLVKVIKSDGTVADISTCESDYNTARTKMLDYPSDTNNVAVIYNSNATIINARYAIAKLTPGNSSMLLYPTSTSTSAYTYTHTSYGSDAAFIDYDPASNRAKIKISGYAGWTDLNNLTIMPITNFSKNLIKILGTDINIRDSYSTSSLSLGKAYSGNMFVYFETKTNEGYTWYRIQYADTAGNNDGYAWIANNGSWLTDNVSSSLQTYYSPYTTGNLIHYFEYQTGSSPAQNNTNLGKAPNYLEINKNYYSFDGNYFYTELTKMLDDYRNGVYSNALNSANPHYPYYMYLTAHSKSLYDANDFNQIIINKEYTRNADPNVSYVQSVYPYDWLVASRTGISKMYGVGQDFVDAGAAYDVNSLMVFGTAMNESGTGTSKIAFLKNNLFGLGAVDSNPITGAYAYGSVRESIMYYAKFIGGNDSKYTSPNGIYFYGGHYGNKGSGMNIKYASDPYWGEKQASNSYNTDKTFGYTDFMLNTIGVTQRADVKVYKEASSNADVLYTLKNNYYGKSVENIPVIVTDKVSTIENGQTVYWYKVNTDLALDSARNVAAVDYNYDYSYAYIKATDLYVDNKQPSITANDITVMQDGTVNILSGVSASDTEDGDLTNKITYTGVYDVKVPDVYPITYSVADNSNLRVTKTINLTVNASLYPTIQASNIEISQGIAFNPLNNVTANDYRDGNLSSSIQVVANNVNTAVKGTYNVTYSIINSLNNVTTKTITVTVIDNAKPVINVTNKVIKINDSFDPMSGVTASDKEDGNLTSSITIISNNTNTSVVGSYKIIYQIKDSYNNITTQEITVSVEERSYTDKSGQFYFEKLNWNVNTQRLELSGYLAITGTNNTSGVKILYDLLLKNNTNGTETVIGLDRWLDGHPTRSYSDGTYNYSDTWFSGSVDLSSVTAGEYTMYIRARTGNYQSINLFRNILGKDMVRKIQTNAGRGYLIRNNNYSREFPIELFISDNGLISTAEPIHSSNMYNNYKNMDISNNSLNIVGASFNINGDYSSSAVVERNLILENKTTHERLTYSIGSFVGSEIPLNLSDGKSKVRGWFDTTGKVNLTNVPIGQYIIYVRTKTGNIDDYGELTDIFLKPTNSVSATINGKVFKVNLNTAQRFRLELSVTN